jgi:hypothetical protein
LALALCLSSNGPPSHSRSDQTAGPLALRRDKLILRRAVLTRPAMRRDEQERSCACTHYSVFKEPGFLPTLILSSSGEPSKTTGRCLVCQALCSPLRGFSPARGRSHGGGAGRRTKKLLPQRAQEQSSAATCRGVGSGSSGRQPQPAGHARDKSDYTTRRAACQPGPRNTRVHTASRDRRQWSSR